MNQFFLTLAGVPFRLRCDEVCRDGLERFRKAWSSAPQCDKLEVEIPFVDVTVSQERSTGSAQVHVNSALESTGYLPSTCHWALESAVFQAVARYRPHHTRMMHAGCVVGPWGGILFIGPSGAGKSSLCLEALERGYRYLSDEALVTDGRTVWGVPRAIQFDRPGSHDAPFPAWLRRASLDFDLYPESDDYPNDLRPLYIPGIERTDERRKSDELTVVLLRHGEADDLKPLSSLQVLTELLGASFLPLADVDLGPLTRGGGHELVWSTPSSALTLLEDELRSNAR